MKLIIQIPCLNEANTLAATIADLPKEIPGIDIIEYMIIDDGSTDDTVKVAKECGVHHIISHGSNRGLATAFTSGRDYALENGADILVNTDADNQYYGPDIALLVQPIIENKAEIVVGCRPIVKHPEFSPIKKLLQLCGSWALRKISKTTVRDAPSGFRAFSRQAMERIFIHSKFSYCMETLVQAGTTGMRVASVDDGEISDAYTLDIEYDCGLGDEWEKNISVNDMYIYNDMLAVVGTVDAYHDTYTEFGWDYDGEYQFFDDETTTFVSFYTKENEPQHLGTYTQDGSYDDVRIAPDGYMYLVTKYRTGYLNEVEGSDDLESYVPKCGVDNSEYIPCESILLPENELDNYEYMSYTVIGSIDLTVSGEFTHCDTKALASYTGNLYSSADNLYTATGWEKTDITRIAIGGGQIVPQASGTVEGFVKDQFSFSEYNGYLRVATTVDKWVDNGNFIKDALDIPYESRRINHNNVYVLDMDMNIVGSVEEFGKDESIKSVSFSGNMGYVVTYEQTDPLFGIDLSDPANPFITDEFKILGYSTYMQQWDEGLLLGFGADADEYGRENGVINVKLHSEKDKTVLSVRDNGIGISKEDLPKIWNRFYRADASRKLDFTPFIMREIATSIREHCGRENHFS